MNQGNTKQTGQPEYALLIGIDWSSAKHDVWIYNTLSGRQSSRIIKHSPESIREWVFEVQKTCPGQRVAICLEQTKGALIHALLDYEFISLYPINPAVLAKYREAFTPSRAKDDPTDAKLLMELLLKHCDKLKVWRPADEQTRSLSLFNEERRRCVDLRTKLVLRLQALLKGYYPQAMDLLSGNLSSQMACDFIQRWPALDVLKRARPQTIRSFYYAHNYRREDLIAGNLDKISNATALTTDAAIIRVSMISAQALARQIRLTLTLIEEYDEQIQSLFDNHPDAFIFKSLPGAGSILAPRLLSAFGSDRERYADASEIQTYSGIAPVVERSGKQEWIHWRWRCPTFLRQSFHEFANCSRGYSVWAEAHYALQRERGKKHHAAVRSLAYKWQRIIFRCWQDRKPYDEAQYIHALQLSGSPLWPRIQELQGS
ncbi:MAG TPA: transposase [Pontiella sp.]|nr:transposase [Pontiella sp.]